jgi:programmed cell death protein 4
MDRIEDSVVPEELEAGSSTNGAEKQETEGEKNLKKKPVSLSESRMLKRKNKKLEKKNSKEGQLGVSSRPNFVAPERKWKNSRRSHNGFGRGQPKKGGAGGKHVWGKLGSELQEETLDPNDPNFEEEEFQDVEFKEIVPEMTDEEFLRNLHIAILEYYETGDTSEVAVDLDNYMTGAFRPLVIKKAIEIAMEHKNSHREMTSVLISDLYGRCLTSKDFEKGFDLLLAQLSDLVLDTPDAPHVVGNFLARAVADDCLPPKYVHQLAALSSAKNGAAENAERHLEDLAVEALKYAEGHLSMPSGWAHLDNIWGVAGGLRPVKTITTQMELLLKEYLLSRDIEEAERCVNALEVPHFHHELVYEVRFLLSFINVASKNIENYNRLFKNSFK